MTGRPHEEELGVGWPAACTQTISNATPGSSPRPPPRASRSPSSSGCGARTGPIAGARHRPAPQEGGPFQGYLGSCFDITDRKHAEEHIEHALAEKEALLAEVYHRVRNNLQVMVSLIGLYGRAAPDACRGSFEALGQRVRAIALVQQHLHEAPHIASIDLKRLPVPPRLRPRAASKGGAHQRPGRRDRERPRRAAHRQRPRHDRRGDRGRVPRRHRRARRLLDRHRHGGLRPAPPCAWRSSRA